MEDYELGVCNAIISGISTIKDGSVRITLEVNPEDQKLINQLMNNYLLNNRLVSVAFVLLDPDKI
jgi:hypothetical protein